MTKRSLLSRFPSYFLLEMVYILFEVGTVVLYILLFKLASPVRDSLSYFYVLLKVYLDICAFQLSVCWLAGQQTVN